MPKITDTYARAYDCCDAVLTETGRFPTIDAIRERIGVNSPNTIKKAINAWTQAFAEKHFDKMHRPDIPTVLLDSVEQIWKLAIIEAEQSYRNKEASYQNALKRWQTAFDQQQLILQMQTQTLTEAGEHIIKMSDELIRFKAAGAEKDRDKQILSDKIAVREKQLAERDNELEAQEKQWQKKEKDWKERQDKDQLWFARRLNEEKQFLEEQWQTKYQRQSETIRSLKESEEVLRQACASLRSEHQKLKEELQKTQQQMMKKRFGFQKKQLRFKSQHLD